MTSTIATTADTPTSSGRGGRVRVPRGRRGSTATLVAVLAVLVCAFGAVEAISLAAHRRGLGLSSHDVAKFGRDTQLSDTSVFVVGVVVAAVGLVLLLAAFVPARRRLVELKQSDPTVAAGLTMKSLLRTLAAAASGVDGISGATVKGRRRITVRARTSLRETSGLPGLVETAVQERIDTLEPDRRHHVRVKLKARED